MIDRFRAMLHPARIAGRVAAMMAVAVWALTTFSGSGLAQTNPPAAASARAPLAPGDQSLDAVLDRATEYVTGFQRAFSAAVAEERYQQTLRTPTWNGAAQLGGGATFLKERRLRSDLLLVRPAGMDAWFTFRDVFEVDGTPVRDREQRLQRLFLEAPGTALDQAGLISAESARYNLGPVERTVNVPTLALSFLEAENRQRCKFKKQGEDKRDGVTTWRIAFTEKSRPTLIRTPGTGGNVPSSGRLWIDPTTGCLLRTEMVVNGPNVTMSSTVEYRPNEALGIWVPAEMTEHYEYATGAIDGVATYSNVRRFTVSTTEELKTVK
jgi:hypothetical protein